MSTVTTTRVTRSRAKAKTATAPGPVVNDAEEAAPAPTKPTRGRGKAQPTKRKRSAKSAAIEPEEPENTATASAPPPAKRARTKAASKVAPKAAPKSAAKKKASATTASAPADEDAEEVEGLISFGRRGRGKAKAKVSGSAAAAAAAASISPSSSQEPTGPAGEKRERPWVPECTADTAARIERAVHQRLFMINRNNVGPRSVDFSVLGSTGNVYTVKFGRQLKCNCFDGRARQCKHILFVLLKILRVPRDSPLVYQRALLDSEIDHILEHAAPDPTAVADNNLQRALKQALGELPPDEEAKGSEEGRKPIEGDCPICYDTMSPTEELVWCRRQCGNNVHKECFGHWMKSQRGTPTCVYCRAQWQQTKPNVKNATKKEGYLNLGGLAGQPSSRRYA